MVNRASCRDFDVTKVPIGTTLRCSWTELNGPDMLSYRGKIVLRCQLWNCRGHEEKESYNCGTREFNGEDDTRWLRFATVASVAWLKDTVQLHWLLTSHQNRLYIFKPTKNSIAWTMALTRSQCDIRDFSWGQ